MYNADEYRNLEVKSHVRGAFAKEQFSTEINEKERKKRQMKEILDQQVEQRRR